MQTLSGPYLTDVRITDAFAVRDLRIELPPPEGRPFRHLVLTGRNGSGKTAVLRGIADGTGNDFRKSSLSPGNPLYTSLAPPLVHDAQFVQVFSGSGTRATGELVNRFLEERSPLIQFHARRWVSFATPDGPTAATAPAGADKLEQLLINWHTQAAYAFADGDLATDRKYRAQIAGVRDRLAELLAPVAVDLQMTRETIRYHVVLDGAPRAFDNLPDGAKAALQLWIDTWTALEARKTKGIDGGYILLDEPETHLHLALQERILPFLARSFPTVQIIAATHAPAVAASLDGALIYDLSQRRGWLSEDLHPWRYGRVMTEIFGLDDEYSISTSADLHRLYTLSKLDHPSAEEAAELRALADRLRATSHAMALEVWLRLNVPQADASR